MCLAKKKKPIARALAVTPEQPSSLCQRLQRMPPQALPREFVAHLRAGEDCMQVALCIQDTSACARYRGQGRGSPSPAVWTWVYLTLTRTPARPVDTVFARLRMWAVNEHKFFVPFAPRTPTFPPWRKWGSTGLIQPNCVRGHSSQLLSYDGPHSHGSCLKDACLVLSCSISSDVLWKRTGSSMTKDCCVSPWTDGCVSIISRLSHRTECQISNMTGNHRKKGLCQPHGCTSGRCSVQMGPVERWKEMKRWSLSGHRRLLLLLTSASASPCLPRGCSVLACLSNSSPTWALFHYILPSFCCGKIQQQKCFPHFKTNDNNEDKCDFSYIHSKH